MGRCRHRLGTGEGYRTRLTSKLPNYYKAQAGTLVLWVLDLHHSIGDPLEHGRFSNIGPQKNQLAHLYRTCNLSSGCDRGAIHV